jgi:hypothetical protein
MCRACEDKFPTRQDHRSLSDAAADLRERVSSGKLHADDAEFVESITQLDHMRFGPLGDAASPEWGQPETASFTRSLVFCSKKPSDALTLFVLMCWYDMGENYTFVGSRRLSALAEWIASPKSSLDSLADGRYPWPKRCARATWSRCEKGGFGRYFAETVETIAREHPKGVGNIWRFIGQLGLDLTDPGGVPEQGFKKLRSGSEFVPVEFKRAWMLLMFLRRDKGIIRCLLERALAGPRGRAALGM